MRSFLVILILALSVAIVMADGEAGPQNADQVEADVPADIGKFFYILIKYYKYKTISPNIALFYLINFEYICNWKVKIILFKI